LAAYKAARFDLMLSTILSIAKLSCNTALHFWKSVLDISKSHKRSILDLPYLALLDESKTQFQECG